MMLKAHSHISRHKHKPPPWL